MHFLALPMHPLVSDFGFRTSSPMNTRADQFAGLTTLSHELGAEHRNLAILGEGNVSARLSRETFLVKASGSSLGSLGESDLVECRFAPLLAMLDRTDLSDQQIEDELFACRVHPNAKKPSVEALFHAFLLSLEGVSYVGHTHPISVNQILCSDRATDFASRRLFPDEIVCCGPASVFIPYTDPGLQLARVIRTESLRYRDAFGAPPRAILLENHGLITLGASPNAVKAAMFMADKAAHIFAGAAALGGPRFLAPEQVDRIANRIDEHYRQRALKL
jgi:rhamnose utilization protein RhaD (predicted bifunctional aldolase and dehydrogenase)